MNNEQLQSTPSEQTWTTDHRRRKHVLTRNKTFCTMATVAFEWHVHDFMKTTSQHVMSMISIIWSTHKFIDQRIKLTPLNLRNVEMLKCVKTRTLGSLLTYFRAAAETRWVWVRTDWRLLTEKSTHPVLQETFRYLCWGAKTDSGKSRSTDPACCLQ